MRGLDKTQVNEWSEERTGPLLVEGMCWMICAGGWVWVDVGAGRKKCAIEERKGCVL
jgi:hypothetical protein